MTGPVIPAGVQFTLRVPSTWIELEVQPSERDRAIERLVAGRARETPELRPYRGAVTTLLKAQAEQAWEAGAAFVSVMVEPTADGPITASAVVMVVPGPAGVADDDESERLAAMSAPFVTKAPADVEDTWRRIDIVDIPGAGPAVRVAGVEDVPLPGQDGAVRVVSMQTLVPLPQGQVLLLTCSSPVLPLTEALLDVFDALSGTLEVHALEAAP